LFRTFRILLESSRWRAPRIVQLRISIERTSPLCAYRYLVVRVGSVFTLRALKKEVK